jgi:hypothetical protein
MGRSGIVAHAIASEQLARETSRLLEGTHGHRSLYRVQKRSNSELQKCIVCGGVRIRGSKHASGRLKPRPAAGHASYVIGCFVGQARTHVVEQRE